MKKITPKILWITLIIIVLLNIVMVFYQIKEKRMDIVTSSLDETDTEETELIVVKDTTFLE
ncbi:MAG: hypothetical protein IJT04_06340 [Bacteroidales bacterium]|nr:hypothetical protein [Bacteroidales bacterium]